MPNRQTRGDTAFKWPAARVDPGATGNADRIRPFLASPGPCPAEFCGDGETALRPFAAEAKAAHQAGDYRRAAALYWQGWRLDPSGGGFLYGSARALDLADELEQAIARYQAFLALRRQDSELVARSRGYLAEAKRRLASPPAVKLPAEPAPVVEAPPVAPPAAPTSVTLPAWPTPEVATDRATN
ncbi:MAG: hypothetical protein EXR77_15515 [Myxococcales bacterium]|nr:hypothetical protein [Myxococcales bacterium]